MNAREPGQAPGAAATPGQAAYETVYGDVGLLGGMWHALEPFQRDRWEVAAQAGIDVFLAGDSVSAGTIREALAAREPQPAPGDSGEIAYLYHWRFEQGEEFGLYWCAADADAQAAKRAGEGLSEVLSMAILGDRPAPQPAPGPLALQLIIAVDALRAIADEPHPGFGPGCAAKALDDIGTPGFGEPQAALNKKINEAEADRDDYAARLKAADQSWAKLAAERDQLRRQLREIGTENIRLAAEARMLREAGPQPAPGSLRARVLKITEGLALAAQANGPGLVAEMQAKAAAELYEALQATEAS